MDLNDDPEFKAWTDRVRAELIPMIEESEMTVSICPVSGDDVDIKFAVELGVSIMLDKPIIVAVPPGRSVPDGLARVAHEIIEMADDPAVASALVDEANQRRLPTARRALPGGRTAPRRVHAVRGGSADTAVQVGCHQPVADRYWRTARRTRSLTDVCSRSAAASTSARNSGSNRTGTPAAAPEPIGGRPGRAFTSSMS